MLLKIGKTYINTDNVVEFLEDGDRVTVYYNTNDETGDVFTATIKDEEAFALLRWLDANSTDIMATEPAPVETPFQHKFKVGDNVIVKPGSALIEYDNQKGTVISTAPYQDLHPYLVRFGAGDTDMFGDDQLELAPTTEAPRNDNAIPKTMRTFVIGQTVRVRDDVDGEASAYTGRTGQVTLLDRSRASGVVRYFTTLSTHDAFYADQLEPAD